MSSVNLDYGVVLELSLFKNGNNYSTLSKVFNRDNGSLSKEMMVSGSDTVSLGVGDYIDIRIFHDHNTAITLNAENRNNYVSVTKVGDALASEENTTTLSNRYINGSFEFWQRQTTHTFAGGGAGYNCDVGGNSALGGLGGEETVYFLDLLDLELIIQVVVEEVIMQVDQE